MNERIKELAKQSGISILYEYDGYDGHAGVANLTDIEKFAELIVGECISKLDGIGAIDRDSRTIAMKAISEHFGVEE